MENIKEQVERKLAKYHELFLTWMRAKETIEKIAKSGVSYFEIVKTEEDFIEFKFIHKIYKVVFEVTSIRSGKIVYKILKTEEGKLVEREFASFEIDKLGNVNKTYTVDDADWHYKILADILGQD